MPALVIPIHDLDSAGRDYVFALDESWLRQAFGDTGVRGDTSRPGSVEVHAQRNGREILVHGRANAWLITECGRCLQEIPVPVECELAALYAPSEGQKRKPDSEDEELDIDPDEPDREFYSGEQVAIDDLVRDYLLLELPMQPRCEPSCQSPNLDLPEHLRSAEGGKKGKSLGEDTIDPRLMPLMKLVKGEPDKE